jgi:hypothetical protein
VDRDTTRYEPAVVPRSTPAELAGFAGSYYSDELDTIYSITARDTLLAVKFRDEPERSVTRTGPQSFANPGVGAIRFTRARDGKVDGFLLFGGLVRNLRFTKQR